MDNQSEQQKLAARFEKKKAAGLVDVKFFLRNVGESTTDDVYRDVNALYEAFEEGKRRPLDFGDAIN